MRKFLKLLHTFGAIGYAGGLAAYMLLATLVPDPAVTVEFATVRQGIADVSGWIILPSMVALLLSGLLSMAVHHPFQNMGWVWAKALTGLLIFEATLATVDGPAKRAAAAAHAALNGELAATELALRVNDRIGALWVLLFLAAINVVLAIWRPRFIRPSQEAA